MFMNTIKCIEMSITWRWETRRLRGVRVLLPEMIAEPNRKKKRLPLFPGQDSVNEKPWTLCLL